MTLMTFLLLIIFFLAFFIYFAGLNPQDVTIHFLPDQSITFSVAIVVVSCVLFGLALGYCAHIYGAVLHRFKHWQQDRKEKKTREIAAIYREGVGRLLSGDLKKAHALLQKALDRDPKRVETRIALASALLQEGKSQEALEQLRQAREIEPKSLEVLFKQAATFEETGREEEAVQAYQEILTVEAGNRKALRSLRDLQMKHGHWSEAMEVQRKVLKAGVAGHREQEEKRILLYLRYEAARQGLEKGEMDQAVAEFKDISKQDPEFVPARVSLGDAQLALQKTEEAARTWQQGYRDLGKSVFLSRLEDAYLEAEDPSTLLTFYRNALEERKGDLMLRLFYGKFCLRLEMVDEALEQLYAVESAGVDSQQLHLLLAEAHRRRSRTDESISEYQKALGVSGRLHLSYVCEECGERSQEWRSRCPECGNWGKVGLTDRKSIQNARPLELREIHHGEREEWNEA